MSTQLSGWSLTRVRGVDIKVHFSFVFLLLYVMLVAGSQFHSVVSASGVDLTLIQGGAFLWSVIFSFSLCTSIVLHELGHVWMAQRQGVKVQSVTLMMLGGVSEMGKIPDRRFSEFKISIVGPLVSFLIAAGLYAVQKKSSLPGLVFFSYWLARVNLSLGIFNLIPAYPMDGGRVLRSLLEIYQGKQRALKNTVKTAKALAWVFGIVGFLGFNFLLMMIGVFVYIAAAAEESLALNEALLKGVRVADICNRTIVLSEEEILSNAAREFVKYQMRVLPVSTITGRPALVSVFRLRQVPVQYWSQIKVKAIMDQYEMSLTMDSLLEDVFAELTGQGALPIEHDGQLIGVIQARQVSDYLEFKSIDQECRSVLKPAA
jgi:Zn-dependent protease